MSHDPYWDEPAVVDKFADREPDRRLAELLDAEPHPETLRVLDLGCAGGRNTELLAKRGVRELWAVDASRPMVDRTRERLAPLLGATTNRRIVRGSMTELDSVLGERIDRPLDLIVALGVLHMARSRAEWDQTLHHLTQFTQPGSRLLVAIFTPRTDLTGQGNQPVPGEPHVYDGFPSGRAFVLEADDLDAELLRFGFEPEIPSVTVEVATERGRRVTVNASYRRSI